MRTLFLSLFLGACLPLISQANEAKTLSPSQLLTQEKERLFDNSTEFTIQFCVHSVAERPTTYPDGSKHQVLHLIPRGNIPSIRNINGFTVPLTREIEAQLHRIGISDIKNHFSRKVLTMKGVVSQTGLMLIGSPTSWTHHISIRSLDQIVSLKEPAPETD